MTSAVWGHRAGTISININSNIDITIVFVCVYIYIVCSHVAQRRIAKAIRRRNHLLAPVFFIGVFAPAAVFIGGLRTRRRRW